ncbi:MAG: NosD domain-containing protein [Candidatus Thorarchaeota archaeon]
MSIKQFGVLCILILLITPVLAEKDIIHKTLSTSVVSESTVESHTGTRYNEHPRITIFGDTEFAAQGWPGDGTPTDPFIIENLNITADSENCIMIFNVSIYFVIRNSIFTTSGEFADNIQIISSRNGIIDNCTITGGRYGVYISSSSGITVANSTIYGSTSIGITVYTSDNCVIQTNTIYGNVRGIRFQTTVNSIIMANVVYRSEQTGIVLFFNTADNQIFYNFIGWNGPPGFIDALNNAADNGENNIWDDNASIGNFWSGYEGNEPYRITGQGDARDRFPQYFNDTQKPQIRRVGDLAYEDGDEQSHFVNWTANDAHPYRYEITRNSHLIASGIWHNQDVIHDVGGLGEGVYNFTINFIDGSGNQNNDTVRVFVVFVILGGIGTDLVGFASILTAVVVLFSLVLVRKLR